STTVDNNQIGLFMDWDQVREIHQSGMDIGSHTHSHLILSHLPRFRQEEELGVSKSIIEKELKAPVVAIAYPVGGANTYTEETKTLAQAAGYQLGFNQLGHTCILRNIAPFDIPRVVVHDLGRNCDLRSILCFPKLAH